METQESRRRKGETPQETSGVARTDLPREGNATAPQAAPARAGGVTRRAAAGRSAALVPQPAPEDASDQSTALDGEIRRVKLELDRSNAVLKHLLRELDERGPNSAGVPQIWESVRRVATESDQLIQRLERLRTEREALLDGELRAAGD